MYDFLNKGHPSLFDQICGHWDLSLAYNKTWGRRPAARLLVVAA